MKEPVLNITSIISITCNNDYVIALTNSGAIWRKPMSMDQKYNNAVGWQCINEGDTRYPKPGETKEVEKQ